MVVELSVNVTSSVKLLPDVYCRPAIAWATWDLIAVVETGGHDGPATHAVTFVWNGHEVIDDQNPYVLSK